MNPPLSPPPAPPPAKTIAWHNAFITGLFLLAPLGVSLWVVNLLVQNVGDPASKIFFGWMDSSAVFGSAFGSYMVEGASLLIVLVLITILGYASHYLFGKWLLRRVERIVLHVPFVNQIYRMTKQIVGTFHNDKNAAFQKMVLIQFPRAGLYSIGFLTKPVEGEVRERAGDGLVSVFIPTTPNPTSGFLVMCPARELIELNMSVGDGMKFIISGGAITPANSAAVPSAQTIVITNPADGKS
jgi:uncharacterized membrane protein